MPIPELNLIVICLDTFRADMIGTDQKMSFVETPNLDAFARRAVSFERAFGEAQPTLQMRRAFFTGRRSFPWRYNFDRRGHWHHAPGWHKIPPDQDTLAEILVQRGVFTGLVADTYHMFRPTMNFTRGFCTYEFIRGQEWDNWRGGTLEVIADDVKRHSRPGETGPQARMRQLALARYLWNQRGRRGEHDYQCARVFRSASRWLNDNAANSPFFLWVDSFDPHEPWDPPVEYADRYYPYDGIDFIYPNNEDATPEERERTKALYCGEATLVDKWAGTLLETIDQLDLWQSTVVVVTSDHGTQILDHGKFGKGADCMHAYNTRIPLYIAVPDGPQGRQVDAFVQSHDLLPTLLGLLDVPYARVEGQDAWPLVTGERAQLRDHVVIGWAGFSTGNAGGRASVRDDRWNYVTSIHEEDPTPELYDLETDPEEQRNVHDAHPDIVGQQRTRLEAVVGQPLPAQLNEVCDFPLLPIMEWSLHRFPQATPASADAPSEVDGTDEDRGPDEPGKTT
jgi:arylsulfatase A-like enzyme